MSSTYQVGPKEYKFQDQHFDWIVYWFDAYDLLAVGEAVGLLDGRLYVKDLSKTDSKFGLLTDAPSISIEQENDAVHQFPRVKTKVLELLDCTLVGVQQH